MTKLAEFSEFVFTTQQISSEAARASVRALHDLLGVAAAGSVTEGGRAARKAARTIWGDGPAGIWFSQDRSTVAGAAFVNAVYASMLDLDDGHRRAAGHPGAAMVPAVLAAAHVRPTSAERILAAIAIGYEVGTRVAAARDFETLRTTDTGQWCGYGVAAAVGWLRGLRPETLTHAMAIAGHTACGQFATGWTRVGHMAKEGIAWATAGGIAAVDLAEAGFTGPIDLLDDPDRYDQSHLTAGLGESWAIEASYQKIYSACRWAHGPVDAVLTLQAEHGIRPGAIKSIEIATFGRALTLINAAAPDGIEAAQYSIPFSIGLAAVRGPEALLLPEPRYLADPEVIALARRVKLSLDPELDPLFPTATPCRVTIHHEDGTSRLDLAAPRGEPSNPLSADDLRDKFIKLATPALGPDHANRLERTLSSLHEISSISTFPLFESLEGSAVDETPLFSELATG